jgi:cyanophycinase-like exopeptidase
MARQRLGRLIAFLARLSADEKPAPARLIGLGIDEGTALCVEPDATAKVFTEKNGLVWLVAPTRAPDTLAPGQPLATRSVQVIGLGPDSALHLATLKTERPAAVRLVSAAAGKLLDDPASAK